MLACHIGVSTWKCRRQQQVLDRTYLYWSGHKEATVVLLNSHSRLLNTMGALKSRHKTHELNHASTRTFKRFSSTEFYDENAFICPVCNHELHEPKIIPTCQHNVCKKCLLGLVKSNFRSIKCPVCRRATTIRSKARVSELSTNIQLVQRIQDEPGWHERNGVKQAVEESVAQLDLFEVESRRGCNETLERIASQGEEVKREIHEQANTLVNLIREHERVLLHEVNNATEAYRNKREESNANELKSFEDEMTTLKAKAEEVMSTEADLVAIFEGHEDIIHKLQDFNQKCTKTSQRSAQEDSDIATLTFKCNNTEIALKYDGSLGSVILYPCANPLPLQISKQENTLVNKDQLCQAVLTVHQENAKLGCFLPVAVAVSPISNEIAVLDKANKHVYLLNEKKCRLAFAVEGSPMDLAFCCVTNDIILADGRRSCLTWFYNNQLFDSTSKSEEFLSHSFNSITSHTSGRFIVTSKRKPLSASSSTVLVFNSRHELDFEFGQEQLSSPEKAIYYSEQFFVSDAEERCVKVFDGRGRLLRRFGNKMLTRPAGLSLDSENNYILVCDSAENSVLVFDEFGNIVSDFKTAKKPMNAAKTQNGRVVVACEGSHCVQFYPYLYILLGMS